MSRRVEKVMSNYSERDFEALRSIYNFRCLSKDQLFRLHYSQSWKEDVSSEYLRKKLIKLKQDGLIEEVKPIDKTTPKVYFLSQDGIKALKQYFSFSSNVYDSKKMIHERGYYTYSELRVANRFIAHQYKLNEFAISSIDLVEKFGINYSYTDERHVSAAYGIRPDGILSILGVDLFLEMDMGTETLGQLKEKWNHYRSYLNSQSYTDNGKRVIILFISNNRGRIEQRINLIKHSINENFIDCLSSDVEIYLGVQEKLISVIKNLIVPYYKTATNDFLIELTDSITAHGYKIASGKQIAKHLNNVPYTYYIKHTETNRDFLVQEFFGEPMTGMNRIVYHDNINSFFYKNIGKKISMILVGSSEDIIIKNVDLFMLENSDEVFFSTIKRLKELPFNEAIFKIVKDNGEYKLYSMNEDFTKTKLTEKL